MSARALVALLVVGVGFRAAMWLGIILPAWRSVRSWPHLYSGISCLLDSPFTDLFLIGLLFWLGKRLFVDAPDEGFDGRRT